MTKHKINGFKTEAFMKQASSEEFISWIKAGCMPQNNYLKQASAIAEVVDGTVQYHTFIANAIAPADYFGHVAQKNVSALSLDANINALSKEFAVKSFQKPSNLEKSKIIVLPNLAKKEITYDLVIPNQVMINLGYYHQA